MRRSWARSSSRPRPSRRPRLAPPMAPSRSSIPFAHHPPSSSMASWTTRCGCGRRPVTTFTQRDPGGREAGVGSHRAAHRLRRRRAVCGGADARPRAGAHRAATGAARSARRGGQLHAHARPAPRSPDRRGVRGERGRRAERYHHLQRLLDRRLVGRGVGIGGEDRRHRMVRRDADPVFAAAVLPIRAAHLRHQRDALHPAQEGGSLAGARAEDRKRHGVADGAPRRARRRRPRAAPWSWCRTW